MDTIILNQPEKGDLDAGLLIARKPEFSRVPSGNSGRSLLFLS
ncbi:hypothetical protein [Cytobacillus kochii]